MELSGLRGEVETRHEACTGRERRRRREGTDWVIVEVGGQALARAGLTDGWRGEGVEGKRALGETISHAHVAPTHQTPTVPEVTAVRTGRELAFLKAPGDTGIDWCSMLSCWGSQCAPLGQGWGSLPAELWSGTLLLGTQRANPSVGAGWVQELLSEVGLGGHSPLPSLTLWVQR